MGEREGGRCVGVGEEEASYLIKDLEVIRLKSCRSKHQVSRGESRNQRGSSLMQLVMSFRHARLLR